MHLVVSICGDDYARLLTLYVVNEESNTTGRISGPYSINNDDDDLHSSFMRISP